MLGCNGRTPPCRPPDHDAVVFGGLDWPALHDGRILTTSPGTDDFARLRKAASLCGATERLLVSRTPDSQINGTDGSCDLRAAVDWLQQAPGGWVQSTQGPLASEWPSVPPRERSQPTASPRRMLREASARESVPMSAGQARPKV